MKQTQRHDAIIELVKKQGYVSTEELVEHFSVSPQTIRRDLNDLADQNRILRHHGGAALPSSPLTQRWTSTLNRMERGLGSLRNYVDLYQSYTRTEMLFDDQQTRALGAKLPPGTPLAKTDALVRELQNQHAKDEGIHALYGVSGSYL